MEKQSCIVDKNIGSTNLPGDIIKLKYIAEEIQKEIAEKVAMLGDEIKMACVVIGGDPASMSYINGIKKNSEKLGIKTDIISFPEEITEKELAEKILEIDHNDEYSGVILQMPLPRHIDRYTIAKLIDYRKDIDGVSPFNQGLLFNGKPFMIPATAWAVDITLMKLARERGIELAGKRAAILGRSVTVGKPVLHLLLKRDITPIITHTKTLHTEELTSECDIVVACCGVAEIVENSWIREGAMVIDVGINCKTDECKTTVCGDVNAADVAENALLVTAVPGGIGSVTSALLYANCLKGYYRIHKNEEITFNFER